MEAGAHRPHSPKRHTTARTYVLSGLILCGQCGHRMQGSSNHGRNHYRCRFRADFALPRGMEHPPAVYVREDAIVPSSTPGLPTFSPETSPTPAWPLPRLRPLWSR